MFNYEYLIIFTNLFGAHGKSKLDLVKIMFHFLEDYFIKKFIPKDLKGDQKLYILHQLEKWIAIFSDHVYLWIFNYIPVLGIWEIKIRLGKDNVPLSGALFNLEVFLEGLKRRSKALHPPLAGKMTCNIQWSLWWPMSWQLMAIF